MSRTHPILDILHRERCWLGRQHCQQSQDQHLLNIVIIIIMLIVNVMIIVMIIVMTVVMTILMIIAIIM